jgi:hypothetical protein
MAKADIMEVVNDLFELVLNGTEHFVNREVHCLESFEEYVTEWRKTKIHGAVVEKKKTERLFAESIVAACEGKTSLSKHWQSI